MADGRGIGLFVYGIVGEQAASTPVRSQGVGGEDGVHFVPMGPLYVASSRVPLSSFSQELVRDLLKTGNTQWMEEKALAHATVLQELMQRGPVIPVRFGILFRDVQGLHARLSARRAEMLALLERLAGKLEWGVKAFGAEEKIRETVLEQDAEARSLRDRLKAASSGAAYLRQRKLDLLVKDRVNALLSQWSEELYQSLAEVSWEASMLEFPGGQERLRQDDRMVLNSAHLVWQQETGRFMGRLEDLGQRWSNLGVRFDLSGPWPPYHFVHLDLGVELP